MPAPDPILWPLILQFILILINALFAGAEIAVISMNDNKLAKLTAMGDKRAMRLAELTAQPAVSIYYRGRYYLAGFLASTLRPTISPE